MSDAVMLGAGLILLYFGAEWLVAGAAGLARSYGVRPLVVGLTVVAYGTSSPELVVGVSAGLQGEGAIAVGNVLGSNIANLALILGMTALVMPPNVEVELLRRELPVLLATTAIVPLAMADGRLGLLEAGALLGLAIGYTAWMVQTSRRAAATTLVAGQIEVDANLAVGTTPTPSRLRLALRGLVGLALLVLGGHLLVEGAVGIARAIGMSERVIGLTIVAIGTSLPELATSLIAAGRGHPDIAVGNVIGSNIFNVLLILGGSGLAGSLVVPVASIRGDLVALCVVTALAALAMVTGRRVSRLEGAVLVLAYVVFLVSLLMA
jgi:cation:H+ antiporter